MARVNRILIVGGGSSGWMTAALLAKFLPKAQIGLVEASDIPIIGVGESTNATITGFLSALELDEKAFMRECNAAFKIAIRFANFNRVGGVFYHPLARSTVRPPRGRIQQHSPSDFFEPNADEFFTSSEAGTGNVFSRDYFSSYQIDAGLFAEYLKRLCKSKMNVQHTIAEVEGAELTDAGEIACIRTKQAGRLVADLYVDCTGFRSLLLGQSLREPFESSSHLLLNDRAIAARVPYVDKERELVTYTNCTALSAGWVWSIPLWSRLGTGYVYSSAHLSKTQAEEEFRRHLGVERVRDLTFSHLDVRIGRHRRAWVGNCVAVGISYGFLEPLESTGLSLTMVSLRDLARALLSDSSIHLEREAYNWRQRELFDSTRDFIVAHYVLTSRDDTPYWRHIRDNIPLPDTLVAALSNARQGTFETLMGPNHGYTGWNWNFILSGMGFYGSKPAERVEKRTEACDVRNHAEFLNAEIFNGESSPLDHSTTDMPLGHPTWYPSWSGNTR